jgi:putative radical SAM enzyme (TIGR03279 family)
LKKFTIPDVLENSILYEMEVEAGDILLSINSMPVNDILDYRYLTADDALLMEIEKSDGEIWELEIEKEFEEDLGIIFPEDSLGTKTCKNNCIFCFIDQLPEGMRESLYVKDDDERLSFLTGNYITMTNLTSYELNRILRYRIMPMNLSIHTTNPDLRCKMLKNRFAGDVMTYLETFHDSGIMMNGQIVLVPDYNDGIELERTLRDLIGFYPILQSVSVVPVGLSNHRNGLEPLRPLNQEDAINALQIINTIHSEMAAKYGEGFVYPSDELYLLAQLPIPDSSYYSGFPQIENGVGMIADFRDSVDNALIAISCNDVDTAIKPIRIGIITGLAAAEFMNDLVSEIKLTFPQLDLEIFPIINHFFGKDITISGLLTGQDIIAQMKPILHENNHDLLILPENALRRQTTTLLDDWTLETLSEALNTKVTSVSVDGEALLSTLLKTKINYR